MSFYRSMIRHTATYSVAIIISRLASLLMLPVYTRFLTPADYGLLDILDIVNQIFVLLLGINLGSAMAYFHAREETDEGRLTVAHTAIFGAHLIGFTAAVAGWFLAPFLSRLLFQTVLYTPHCRVTILSLALGLPQEMSLALLRVQNRSATFVRVMTTRLLLVIAINTILLTVFHLGALAMLAGTMTSTLLIVLYLDQRNLLGARWRFDPALFMQQFRFAFPLGLSGLGMTFLHSGDRFFLKRYASLMDVGVYGIAYRLGTLAGYIQPVFENYWNAQVFHIVKGESGEQRYTRTLTYFALVSAAAAVVVSLFSQPIVRLATPKPFHQAMAISPLIACCYAWRGIGDYFRNAFAIKGVTKKNLHVTLAGVVLAVITYATLIPRFKLWGAAIATALTFFGMSFISYRQAQKLHHYHFEWRRLSLIVVCSLACILPYPLLAKMGIVAQFGLGALLTLAFPVFLWITRFFEPEETSLALHYLSQARCIVANRLAGSRRAVTGAGRAE